MNQKASKKRNWALVVVSSLLVLLGLAALTLSIVYAADFGWWGLFIGLSGLSTTAIAVMSIVKNDPTWIMLDLLLPK